MKNSVWHIARGGLQLLVCVVAAELVLSLAAPDYRNQIFDNAFTGGWPVDVDDSGQRGTVVARKKSANEVRILVLGDSVSFGTGTSAHDTWPKQLSNILSTEHQRVTCINAAMPGRSLKDNLADYREHWVNYQPDIVLIGVTNNMVALSYAQRFERPARPGNPYLKDSASHGQVSLMTLVKRGYKQLILPSFLSVQVQRLSYWIGITNHNVDASDPRGPLLAFGYQQADLSPDVFRGGWTQFEDDLKVFRDSVVSEKAHCCVVTFPVRFMLSTEMQDNEKCVPRQRLSIDSEQRFAEICRQNNIAFVETGPRFLQKLKSFGSVARPDWFLNFDYTHLSAGGHSIVAGVVADFLQTSYLANP